MALTLGALMSHASHSPFPPTLSCLSLASLAPIYTIFNDGFGLCNLGRMDV